MKDIKRRIERLKERIKGDDRTEEAIEAERTEIEKYERIAAERLKKIREEWGR